MNAARGTERSAGRGHRPPVRACGPSFLRAASVLLVLGAPIVLAFAPRDLGAAEPPGSILGDSLRMPTETFVFTRADLIERNVHTLDDILRFLPGVSFVREGPPAADGGFSIDGRASRGMNLLVNGTPVVDAFTRESFARFLPLSRILRVEVVYSGSPALTGDLSSAGAINIVLEEGGREGPSAEVAFTYGGSKERARRVWFATPKAHVSAMLAYDEYLQDARESYPSIPRRLLGNYHMRSVLCELSFMTDAGENAIVRFQRFEDSYAGTSYRSDEEVRWSGYRSEMVYRRGGFSGSLRQQALLFSRRAGKLREHTLGASARWGGSIGALGVRAFASWERSAFDQILWGEDFAPAWRRIEGGAVLGGAIPPLITWRAGFFGGDHNTAGRYGGAELALARAWSERFSQDVVIARRLRLPSAEELFQPVLPRTISGEELATVGNASLSPEVSDELAIGARYANFTCSIFGRDEKSRIVLSGSNPAAYQSEGTGKVAGVRALYRGSRSILGFDCMLGISLDAFPERSGIAPGVPRYSARGEVGFRRPVFGGTEFFSVKLNTEAAGERAWGATELAAYQVHDFSASLSIMSGRVSFEYRNILDAKYETVPGFEMPQRHYVIGVYWELFD